MNEKRVCVSCGHNWPRPGSLAGSASCGWCGGTSSKVIKSITKEVSAYVESLCQKSYNHAITDAIQVLVDNQNLDINNLVVRVANLQGKGPCAFQDKRHGDLEAAER